MIDKATEIIMLNAPALATPAADITSNLIAHLLFNDDATDSSGNSNDFTAVNTPSYATGIKGNAIDLEKSSSQYVERASFGPSGEDFTVSCWIKPESNPANGEQYYIACRNSTGSGDTFRLYYTNISGTYYIIFEVDASLVGFHVLGGALSTSAFTHVCMTFEVATSGGLKLYINGELEATAAGQSSLNGTNSGPFRFGASEAATPANFFDGLIDEARYYEGRALEADVVSALYGGGTPP